MTIMRVKTTTKGGKYVANNWVAVDALDAYMNFLNREFGAKAAKHTIETHVLKKGGSVLAYTVNGFDYNFKT